MSTAHETIPDNGTEQGGTIPEHVVASPEDSACICRFEGVGAGGTEAVRWVYNYECPVAFVGHVSWRPIFQMAYELKQDFAGDGALLLNLKIHRFWITG
ncbi:hypothetical protein TruAng_001965 [Truncatella angustata]|nr:hypothetical protein TruAng_001965 [Truncatella angustata]